MINVVKVWAIEAIARRIYGDKLQMKEQSGSSTLSVEVRGA